MYNENADKYLEISESYTEKRNEKDFSTSADYPPLYSRNSYSGPKMDKSGIVGIVLTILCFIMLFVALFAPWFTIKYESDKEWVGREWRPIYKWNSYDYRGIGYGEDDRNEDAKEIFNLDSMDNGKTQAFWGIILGFLFSIILIVLGNIHLKPIKSQKLILFFRAVVGVILLLPATFLLICGSKFIGFSISVSTSDSFKYFNTETILPHTQTGLLSNTQTILCIVPYLLFLFGIAMFFLAFGIITDNLKKLSLLELWAQRKKQEDIITKQFSKKLQKLAIVLVILGMLALVTLPLLPIVSGSEGEKEIYISSGIWLSDEIKDDFNFADYLEWVNFSFWFTFIIALIVLFTAIFLESCIDNLVGYLLALIGNLNIIFLILAFIFKILFIIDVFKGEYDGSYWYGYNFLPLLIFIGLIIIGIIYMIHVIKGTNSYFKTKKSHIHRYH